MIDYKRLAAWTHVLAPKELKRFVKWRYNPFVPEKRLPSLFYSFLSREKPIIKYYITDATKNRILKMDVSKCSCSDLSYLKDKCYKKNGYVFFDDGLHLVHPRIALVLYRLIA